MNQYLRLYRGRFALLRHLVPKVPLSGNLSSNTSYPTEDHFDLLLETDTDRLLAWRIPELRPFFVAGTHDTHHPHCVAHTVAERIQDHRAMYLDYEGEISENRGWVSRSLSGIYLCYAAATAATSVAASAASTVERDRETQCAVENRSVDNSSFENSSLENSSIGPLNLIEVENLVNSANPETLSMVLASQQHSWLMALPITSIGTTTSMSICSVSLLMGLQVAN